MNNYGIIALKAVEFIKKENLNPKEAWNIAAIEVFKDKEASIKKGCPKNTFLGLCEEGLVKFVKEGRYTTSVKNKSYAIKAISILENKKYDDKVTAKQLWNLVMAGEKKGHNSQMNVVLDLWNNGLINDMDL